MRLDRRGVAALAAAAAGLAALLVLVVLRAPILEAVVTRALAWRGVDAELHVSVFDFDRAVIEELSIGPADTPTVAARRIEARYSPLGAVRGRLRTVVVEGLELRLTIDGEGARFVGIPLRSGGGGGRPGVTPHVTISDGRAYVATPAGEVTADLELVGGPDEGWSARLSAYPATLAREGAVLEIAQGALEASIVDGAMTLEGDMLVTGFSSPGAALRDIAADVRFAGDFGDAARLDGLVGQGALTLALGGARLEPEAAAQWAGRLVPTTEGPTQDIFGAHQEALREALAEALAELTGDAAFSIAVADGRATAAPTRPATLAAANGAQLSLAPATDVGGALVYDSRAGAMSARDLSVTARLVGALEARAVISSASLRAERTRSVGEAVANLTVAPWSEDGLSLAIDARRLRLVRNERDWSAEIEAELRATGARLGVMAEDAVARLDLVASGSERGVAVAPRGDAPQRLQAARIVVAGQALEDVEAGVAPLRPDGALLRIDDAGARLETRVRDLGAGTELLGGRWAVQLPATELVGSFPPDGVHEVGAYIQAPRLEGRLGEGDAVLQASVVDINLTLAPEARARLRFTELSLGGAALPVSLAHAAGELDTSLVDGAPYEGRVTLTGAEVTDTAPRARIAPLTVSGDAPITEGVLSGALTAVDREGREIVRSDVRHDFAEDAGAVTVATPRFVFSPQGLQPHVFAPILRGPVVNVAGAARAQTLVTWDPAGVEAVGVLELEDVGFDMRYGTIAGLTTRFEVDDLFALTTSEPQRIDIGLIDPGLPLENGVVEVDLRGPTRMRLASASFPFADGVITAAPSEIEWTSERHLVVLLADGVSLETLNGMFSPPGLVVTGSLSGRIPVEARDRSVFITDGELVSDGPGRVSYTGRAAEGIAQQNESTRLAFEALTNFQYNRLVLTLDGDVAGQLNASVRLEGSNPDVLEGHPINFNLNTTADFADVLTQVFSGLNLSASPEGELAGAEALTESDPADEEPADEEPADEEPAVEEEPAGP